MRSLVTLISEILNIYIWVIIASVIMSWLIAFNVINPRNQFVYTLRNVFYQLTEPVFAPIRRFIPSFGGIDFSPIVVILAIFFIRSFLCENFGPCGWAF
jgi:YggT family protein